MDWIEQAIMELREDGIFEPSDDAIQAKLEELLERHQEDVNSP